VVAVPSLKTEQLKHRVSAESKALIERAAALSGRSTSDLATASAYEAAKRTLEERQVLVLSARDSAAFAEALVNPPPCEPAAQARGVTE
jgi:uncharacterized protein (DUF1778 family)